MKMRRLGLVVPGAALLAGRAGAQDSMPMAHTEKKAAPSSSLAVTVEGKTTSFSVAELSAMPQTTVSVINAHTKMQETYAGVRLSEALAKAGASGQAHDKAMLRSYVRAEGTDKYWVLYSEAEVQPAAHAGEVIVALTVGGKALGDDGLLKLVSTEDKKPARWVRNLMAVKLVGVE